MLFYLYVFWLFYLCRHLKRTYRDYKSNKYSSLVDNGIRAKVFNYKTVIYYILECAIDIDSVLLECFFHILTGIIIQIKCFVKNSTNNSSIPV